MGVETLLSAVSGSYCVAKSAAFTDAETAFTGRITTLKAVLAPAARVAATQVTVGPARKQPGCAHTKFATTGIARSTATLVASAGPLLVAVSVTITSLPAMAGVGARACVSARFAIGPT